VSGLLKPQKFVFEPRARRRRRRRRWWC